MSRTSQAACVRRIRPPMLAVAALVFAVGCAGSGGSDGPRSGTVADAGAEHGAGGIEVVATTSILGDVVRNLVGDVGEVRVLLPAGADPHGYEPSAADVASLRDAELIVANGLGLEENLSDPLALAEQDGVPLLELGPHLDPLPFDAGSDHGDDDGHADDEHGPLDPHVFLDPVRMADGLEIVADALAELDAPGVDWPARARDYREELLAAHGRAEELLATVPAARRVLVTNHDAVGYLAARYDLEVIGTLVPGTSTQAEADARAFAELVATIEEVGAPAIFVDTTDRTELADQLASELRGRGVGAPEVVELYTDALGEPDSGADTYVGLVETNARRIADALGG